MKTFTRRELVIAAATAAPALALPRLAQGAAAYPSKNIQFVIPYAPGGGFDVYPRVVAPVMEKYLPNKVNIVPINIAAGARRRRATQVSRAKAGGYTNGSLNIPGAVILHPQQGHGA